MASRSDGLCEMPNSGLMQGCVDLESGDHFVQFYEEEVQLSNAVAAFIGTGFCKGDCALIIATPSHRRMIEEGLEKRGFSVETLVQREQLLFLDAEETLNQFLRDDQPDGARFEQVVGSLVATLTRTGHRLRAFGEMVALLAAKGNKEGALRLEELWNCLAKKHSFTLFCAYPLKQFEGAASTEIFAHICNAHSKVCSPAGQLLPDSNQTHSRKLALLEQRAISLENEVRERKQAEEALGQREAQLREFLENAVVGLHWVGPDGVIQWANQAELDMLGYTASEYIGRHILEFHADASVATELLARLHRGEAIKDFVGRMRRKDGALRHVLIDSSVRWKDGKFIHTQCFTRDITEKKMSEESLRQLLSLMPAGVYSCDALGKIDFFNRRAVELWGYEPKITDDMQRFCACHKVFSLDGKFIPPDQTPMALSIKEGKSFRGVEATVERPDGSRFIASVNIDPLRDDTGNVIGAINVFQDVTERKLEQQAAQKLAAIVEFSDDAIIARDLDGIITSWNAGAERLYGYRASEVIGKSIALLIPEGRLDEEPMILARLERGERIEHYETVRRRKDGTFIDISLTVSPIRDAGGRIVGASKVARDITRKKRVEEELRANRERLEAIVENSPECIKIVDRDGTLISMNAAGVAALDVPDSRELVGKNIFHVIAPEFREAFQAMHDQVCAGQKQRLDYQIVTSKGSRRWMETHAVPIRDPKSGAYLHLAVTRDITHRKESEEALRQSEAMFRELADSMPQIVFAAQPNGDTDYFNRRWYELTAATPGTIGEESWLPILHPDDRQKCLDLWHESIRTGQTYQIEYRFRFPKDGEYRWHLGRALPVRDAEGKIIRWFGTCTDIEDQKRAEERLEEAVKQRTASLQEAIAQMEEFSYSISHDLRGPLRAMQGFSQILIDEAASELSPDNLFYLKKITHSAERLDRLVQDVLAYTRVARQEMCLVSVSLDTLVSDVIQTYLGHRAPEAQILVEKPLPNVIGHEPSLVQCISNLLANAVKFVNSGTVPEVRVSAEQRDGIVRLWVNDNGIGIHPDHQQKIFGMFERSPEAAKYEGTGVGLAIVRKAVQRMHGRIGVESTLGKGSRFWVELPASP